MLKQVKGVLRLNLDDLAVHAGVLGGLFLVVHVITALAVRFSGEGSSLMLSGVLLPVVGAVALLIVSVGHVLLTFDQAVRFGRTRRRALALTMGQILIESAFVAALAAGLNWLERTFAPALWLKLSGRHMIHWGVDGMRIPEGMQAEYEVLWRDILFIEDFALDWWVPPLILLLGAAAGLVVGAVVQRFGKWGAWSLWALWMIFFIIFPRLPWRTHEVVNWLIPLLAVIGVVGLLWSVWSLLHATIKT